MGEDFLAIGFDLDYTLWDQGHFAESFIGLISAELGCRLGCGGERVRRIFLETQERLAPGHPHLFDEALRRMGVLDPALVAELVDRYHGHRPPMQVFPDVPATLQRLKDKGRRLFLVTDGASDTQRYKVEALGLRAWFDDRVFTGDFPRILQKPSPFPFLLACRRLGVEPRRCAYVGDNPLTDFEGPRSLGMFTVGVPTGPHAARPVPPGQAPDWRVGALADVGDLL